MSAQLDHIILLVPHETLLNPPAWVTKNFTLAPGGRHADGKTENKLILFKDGTYLELIAFVNDDEKAKEGHWWGKKKAGLIDWAVTFPIARSDSKDTTESNVSDLEHEVDKHFEDLSEQLWKLQKQPADEEGNDEKRIAYVNPAAGGRILADGSEIRWKVAFPRVGASSTDNKLALPFLCYDITPRKLRFSMSDEKLLDHPCGATGIDQVGLLVSKDERQLLGPLMASALNSAREPAVAPELYTTTQMDVGTPSASPKNPPAKVVLMTPLASTESKKLDHYGNGFLAEVVLRVDHEEKSIARTIEENGVVIKFVQRTGAEKASAV